MNKYNKKTSEMAIFTKSKELITLTYQLSENWPKKYRFDLTTRIRNTSIDIYEALIEANEIYVDTKLLDDLRKSIDHLKGKLSNNQTNTSPFLEFKLLTLKLTEANKLDERITKRRDIQNQAFASLKKIDYFFTEAYSNKLINAKKWERVSELITEITRLLKAWLKSDRKRFGI